MDKIIVFLKRFYSVIGFVIFIILLIGCIVFHKIDPCYDIFISIFGTIASFGGILIAIGQIISVKSKTEVVNNAVEKARTQIENLNIFVDMSKHSQFINEIQEYVRSGKYEVALITYKELKDRLNLLLGYIENRKDLKDLHNQLKRIVETASNDVKTLQAKVVGETVFMMEDIIVIKNLENTKTFLDQTSGKLKSRRDERGNN